MRRLRHRTTSEAPKAREQTPLTETIQTDRRGRAWREMSDDELVKVARRIIEVKEIRGRKELHKADPGLYKVLSGRELLGRVGFDEKRGHWVSMNDAELVAHTQSIVDKKGITNKKGLENEYGGLYQTLYHRKLLGRIRFEKNRPQRRWASLTDDALVIYAQRFIDERGIKSREELCKADCGLWGALYYRKTIDGVKFEADERAWSRYSDEKLILFAQRFVDRNGVENSKQFANLDGSLYQALCQRSLIDRIRLSRGLKRWRKMSDDELIVYAQKIVDENEIKNRRELKRVDSRLHSALSKRNLLSRVFAPLETARSTEAVQQVFDGLKEFGEEK